MYCGAGEKGLDRIRNERLVNQALEDMAFTMRSQPCLISIDLNMHTSEALRKAQHSGWTDLGAYFAKEKPLPTFKKNRHSLNGTRPDRLIANEVFLKLIKDFQVMYGTGVPNHAVFADKIKRRKSGGDTLEAEAAQKDPDR